MSKKPRSSRRALLPRELLYSLALSVAILIVGGFGFWVIDPKIASLSDGIWLAFTTAATVGYGDMVPSTHASRIFAVLVVLVGLAVLSLVTASVAALIVRKDVHVEERAIERELMNEIRRVREELTELRALLDQRPR